MHAPHEINYRANLWALKSQQVRHVLAIGSVGGIHLGLAPGALASWESQSLPIGNGSLGANIMGSVEAERITFNEKTLWRGGPNTAKGADYYWNVNKQSAHLLDEIRKAFTEGDQKMAEMWSCIQWQTIPDRRGYTTRRYHITDTCKYST
jgi:hypothetical protein